MAELETSAGAAGYSPVVLRIVYDFLVLFLSNNWAWRCSTKEIQLPLFQKHLSNNHMDVGVGTGYYLANAKISPDAKITLLDLNQNCLEATNQKIGGRAHAVLGDVYQPLTFPEKFDSISMFYLLHCLPGPCHKKAAVFKNMREHLSPNGVLYGTTILGKGVQHNAFGRFLLQLYNKKGIFGNGDDSQKEFEEILNESFEKVETKVQGTVLLFTVSGPRSTLA